MHPDDILWQKWARILQRWKLDGIAAYVIDAGGPLAILAAQALYLGQPFLRQSMPDGQLQALANLFEDQEQGQLFAAYLREGRNQ